MDLCEKGGDGEGADLGAGSRFLFSAAPFEHWWQDPVSDAFQAALRDCIKKHGPITKRWLKSAVKRLYGVLKQIDNGQLDKRRLDAWECLEESKGADDA